MTVTHKNGIYEGYIYVPAKHRDFPLGGEVKYIPTGEMSKDHEPDVETINMADFLKE